MNTYQVIERNGNKVVQFVRIKSQCDNCAGFTSGCQSCKFRAEAVDFEDQGKAMELLKLKINTNQFPNIPVPVGEYQVNGPEVGEQYFNEHHDEWRDLPRGTDGSYAGKTEDQKYRFIARFKLPVETVTVQELKNQMRNDYMNSGQMPESVTTTSTNMEDFKKLSLLKETQMITSDHTVMNEPEEPKAEEPAKSQLQLIEEVWSSLIVKGNEETLKQFTIARRK